MVGNKIKAFFDATPKNIDLALAITLTSLGIGTAIVLSKSSSVQIDGNGVNIQRELIETQIERDQAITVIKVYQEGFNQIQDEAENFVRIHPAGKVFLEEVQEVQEIVEVTKPETLDGYIEDGSESTLEQE